MPKTGGTRRPKVSVYEPQWLHDQLNAIAEREGLTRSELRRMGGELIAHHFREVERVEDVRKRTIAERRER